MADRYERIIQYYPERPGHDQYVPEQGNALLANGDQYFTGRKVPLFQYKHQSQIGPAARPENKPDEVFL